MTQPTGRDSAHGAVGQAADAMSQGIERTADAAVESVARGAAEVEAGARRALDAAAEAAGTPMLRLVLDRTAPAMQEMVRAERDLATFWIELTRDQSEHTIETCRRLAEVRDWREAFQIQSDYLQRSLGRMGEAMARQLKLARVMTTSLIAVGRTELKDAA